MRQWLEEHPLLVVVGSGGVGKTTLAAALGLASAAAGRKTLVMTFDPSLRLKDALGVGEEAKEKEVRIDSATAGSFHAGLLDARRTFDRLVARYAPDDAARRRILENRYYRHLSGRLAGVLEYMAVERLYEVASEKRYDSIVLDTPPTRQALDFLEAPDRIVSFLDSGALKIAQRPWFDDRGRLRAISRLGLLGRGVEGFLDRMVGLGLLRDMAEFFQAFAPLYEGFRERALAVQELLRSSDTGFVLVSGPGSEPIPDTMFFARRLRETGYNVGPTIVNRVHPKSAGADELARWLGARDHRGLDELASLLPGAGPIAVPLLPRAPIDISSLKVLSRLLIDRFDRQSSD